MLPKWWLRFSKFVKIIPDKPCTLCLWKQIGNLIWAYFILPITHHFSVKISYLCLDCLDFVFWTLVLFVFIPLCPKIGVLFFPEFSSNQLQTLAQWLGIGEVCYIFLRISSCSPGFIQDFLDHYVDQCQILMSYFSLNFYPLDFKP